MILEVCCTSVESSVTAEAHGADRLELCMHLEVLALRAALDAVKRHQTT